MVASADLGLWASCLLKKKTSKGEGDLGRSRKAQGRLAACEASSPSDLHASLSFGSHASYYQTPTSSVLWSKHQGCKCISQCCFLYETVLHTQTAILVANCIVSKHSSAWHPLQNVKAILEKLLHRGFLNRPVTHSLEVQLSVTKDCVLWITAVWYWLNFTKTSVAWAVRQYVR